MTEIWVKAAGFPGYEVSNMGRVRSVDRFDAKGRWIPGRVLSNARKGAPRKGGGSYWRIRLSVNRKVFDCAVHTLVLKSFIGPRPEGMDGCHNDGNVDNNCLGNLRWDTCAANQRDKISHGTAAAGERNGSAKLTAANVAFIRASRLGSTALAKMFNVSRTHIQRIRRGDNWTDRGVAVTAAHQLTTETE